MKGDLFHRYLRRGNSPGLICDIGTHAPHAVHLEISVGQQPAGFKGRFVRKKDFQYTRVAMPLKSLDRTRTIPDDANGLLANRNSLIE